MRKNNYAALLLLCMSIIGCQKERIEGIQTKVNFSECTEIGATSATIDVGYSASANLDHMGLIYSRDEVFENFESFDNWMIGVANRDYGVETISVSSPVDEGKCTFTISGLLPNTKYHYCIKMYTNDGEEYYSTEESFSTNKIIYESVDLGLSVKWGSCNIGAENPEGEGFYFSWGEAVPIDLFLEDRSNTTNYTFNQARGIDSYVKTEDAWETYKWCNGSSDSITKYFFNLYNESGDGKKILEKEDDAAFVQLGGNWRMPTWEEWIELKEKCTWTWSERNGIKGYIITNNDAWIFLPYYRVSTNLSCRYWSSTIFEISPDYYSTFAHNYWFGPDGKESLQYGERKTCELIRPVQPY